MAEDDQRALKRAARRAERLAFLDDMPIPAAIAMQMMDSLDEDLTAKGCQHDLRLTISWCEQSSVDPAKVIDWLHSEGAACDCEVLANVEERISDAMLALR